MSKPEFTKHLRELDFTVVAQVHEHWVDYAIYDIEGWQDNAPCWHKAGSMHYPDDVSRLEEAEPYLHGTVKWDGCSNWHFDEQDRVMLHGCSKADVQRFGDVMAYCWEWTRELLPNFDATQ